METRINARIDPSLKASGEAVLEELGMSTTDYIRLMFRQLVMRGGLPFDVKIPNAETLAALHEDVSEKPRETIIEIKERYRAL